MARQIEGQMSLFDINKKKLRPCDYHYKRYIGQEFILPNGTIGKCVRIEPYYTIVDDGAREWALTPSTGRRRIIEDETN